MGDGVFNDLPFLPSGTIMRTARSKTIVVWDSKPEQRLALKTYVFHTYRFNSDRATFEWTSCRPSIHTLPTNPTGDLGPYYKKGRNPIRTLLNVTAPSNPAGRFQWSGQAGQAFLVESFACRTQGKFPSTSVCYSSPYTTSLLSSSGVLIS
jgi:hypothetical protein